MAETLLAQHLEDVGNKYDLTFGFAEEVTGPSGVVPGVFSNEYYQADAGGSVPSSSSSPMLKTLNANAMAKGSVVTIRSVAYVVVEVMPSGYGETSHRLQKK